ncbi:pyridoxal kinase [Martelella soudanensis]|uniref:pyridoxal kinase n=1 Tax=unclassified Martelella TaxID=2629616 RepID=UPI0015DDA2E9|nr:MULTISPECIES: pyridoxal kinase [unclassified Martelella]
MTFAPPAGAIVAISSYVMRGKIGNRAIVFALESLGYNIWSVPTVVLPWHPGHWRATRLQFEGEAFANALRELGESRWRGEVCGVISGYLANAAQAEAIAELVENLRAESPGLIYLCDPVIGDEGGLYVGEDTARAIRDRLLPLADIATPNRFELSWLANRALADNTAMIDAALALGPAEVVVTSAQSMLKEGVATLFVDRRQALLAEHQRVENPPNGLGDLFSALFLAARLAGAPPGEALEKSTASVFETLTRAVREGSDELMPEKDAHSLRAPFAKVGLRQLMHPSRRRKRN